MNPTASPAATTIPNTLPPPNPAPPAPAPAAAPLSTAALQASLRATFAPAAPAAVPVPPPTAPVPVPVAAPGQPPEPPAAPAAPPDLATELQTERAARAALEQRLAALELRPAPPPPAAPAAPAAPAEDLETAQRNLAQWAKTQLRALARNPEAVTAELHRLQVPIPTDGTPESLSAWLEDVRDTAAENARQHATAREIAAADQRRGVQSEQQQAHAIVQHVLPELADPASPRAKLFAQVFTQHPELKNHPRADLIAAATVLGWEQLQPLLHPAAAPAPAPGAPPVPAPIPLPARTAPRPPTPPLPGAPGRLPPSAPDGAPNATALLTKYRQSGDPKDREAWMQAVLAGA